MVRAEVIRKRINKLDEYLSILNKLQIYSFEEFMANPELPGCMADGKTYEESIKNDQIVISEWIDTARNVGREILRPMGRLTYA